MVISAGPDEHHLDHLLAEASNVMPAVESKLAQLSGRVEVIAIQTEQARLTIPLRAPPESISGGGWTVLGIWGGDREPHSSFGRR